MYMLKTTPEINMITKHMYNTGKSTFKTITSFNSNLYSTLYM